MIELFITSFGRVLGAGALALIGPMVICSPSIAQPLNCIAVISSGRETCRDAGGFDSTCVSAKCPEGLTVTGGGGSCDAGDHKIKGLSPHFGDGTFGICVSNRVLIPTQSRSAAGFSKGRHAEHQRGHH